jgi:hypothetical protein
MVDKNRATTAAILLAILFAIISCDALCQAYAGLFNHLVEIQQVAYYRNPLQGGAAVRYGVQSLVISVLSAFASVVCIRWACRCKP